MTTPVRAIAVVLPARDEEARVGRCLASVRRAASSVAVPVVVVVALDRCTDATADVVGRAMAGHPHAWDAVATEAVGRGVGRVRNVGVRRAAELAGGTDGLWLAHTDADSVVPVDWLTAQLDLAAAGADAVVGMVALDDEGGLEPSEWQRMSAEHDRLVATTRRPDGTHGGVWGAHLGVRADVLEAVGGFADPVHGEDAELVRLLDDLRLRVVRSETPVVRTSARTRGRATGGLADLLHEIVLRQDVAAGSRD